MTEFNYEEQLSQARKVAVNLQKELEARVLGKTLPGFSCGCGSIAHGESEAVAIRPAGEEFEYQITDPIVWIVQMRHLGQKSGYSYSVGLSSFIPFDCLNEMFAKRFEGIDTEGIKRVYFERRRDQEDRFSQPVKQVRFSV